MNIVPLWLKDDEVAEALLERTLEHLPPTKSGEGLYIERSSLEEVIHVVVGNFICFGVMKPEKSEIAKTILRFYFDRYLFSAGWGGRRFPTKDVERQFVKDVIAACKIFSVFLSSVFVSELAEKISEVLHAQEKSVA